MRNSIKIQVLSVFSEDLPLTSYEVMIRTGLSMHSVVKALHRYRKMGLVTISETQLYPKKYRYRITKRGQERLDFLNQK